VLLYAIVVLRRAHNVSLRTAAIAARPLSVTPLNITIWGGIKVLSRPINECHWISQLVPRKKMVAPSRTVKPSARRSIHTVRKEST